MLRKIFILLVAVLSLSYALQAALMEEPISGIFAHGLGRKVAETLEGYSGIFGMLVGQDGPEWDATLHGDAAGYRQSCLAQQGDIEIIVKQLEERQAKKAGPVMLVGVSKGAATMFNTVGYCADKRSELLTDLRLVVFDSIYRTPEGVGRQLVHSAAGRVERRVGWLAGLPIRLIAYCMPEALPRIAVSTLCRKYDTSGLTPQKVLGLWNNAAINRYMVIIFVHSQADELVPINDSRFLYCGLVALGYKNVYLIEAENGHHAAELWGESRDFIYPCLRAIYERHGFSLATSRALNFLPAIEDINLDRVAKPTVEEVLARIKGCW